MSIDTKQFIHHASIYFENHGWKTTSHPSFDLAVKKEFQTSIVRTIHSLFFIHTSHMKKEECLKIIEDIHQHNGSQPPLVSAVNIIIFVFDDTPPFDISWLLSNGKKQEIPTARATVSWVVDLPNKKLYTHPGPPFGTKGKKELETILQHL